MLPPSVDPGGLGAGIVAVLNEIVALLELLSSGGQTGAIDLHSMPMAPSDYQQLRNALGDGEVEAVIAGEGISLVRETAVHGVWWLEYRDSMDKVVSEIIEVTQVPELLMSHWDDIRMSTSKLRRQLAGKE
jgi:hydrogenase-1 operon protein HyaF